MLTELSDLRRKYGLRKGILRRLRLLKNRLFSPTTGLEKQFRAIGIRGGDLVLIHAAFSRIGFVPDGSIGFVRALERVLGAEGTIMMPSFPFNDPAFEYASRGELFDIGRTPSAVGQLTEQFRLIPGTLRSLHPTHPYCARGPLAGDFLAGHYRQVNPFGPGTPLYRFVEMGGKCLLVGVGLKNCSPFRVIEDPATYPYPVFEADFLEMPVRDEDGKEFLVKTLVHSKALSPARKNEHFREHLLARGMLHSGKIGQADSLLVDCRGLLDLLAKLLAQGVSPYSHLPVPAGNS